MISLFLQFPGDAIWTDVSSLVRPHSYAQSIRLLNDACESVVDTATVSIAFDSLIAARIMDTPMDRKILCKVYDAQDGALFSGYLAPALSVRKGKRVEDLSLEIRDNSWRLDVPLVEDFQMPSSITDSAVSVRSIYEAIILSCGYAPSDILADAMAAEETVRIVSVAKGECTYRQLLDSILRDHGYVFTMTADGKFSLYRWNSGQYVSQGTVNRNISVVDAFEISKDDEAHDGIKLTWSELEMMDHVRLYGANLPVGEDAASSGITILPDRYYPADGDVVDTFQKYQSEWLDEPYQARKSRMRNKDITLITSEDHSLVSNSDEGIVVDIAEYGTHSSRVLFHNPTLDAKKLFVFEVYGRALFRSSKRETIVPAEAVNPREESTEHIYTSETAERLATGLYRFHRFGNFSYRFSLREKLYAPGDVVTITQDEPALDTVVLITEVSWTDGYDAYHYKARGVSIFADVQSVTFAYQATKSGKGEKGDKGEDAYQVQVVSNQGTVFRMGQGFSTILEAKVFHGGEEITHLFSDPDFRWSRTSTDACGDAIWNAAHYSTGGKVLTITQEDVAGRSNFFCDLLTKRS